MTLALCLNCGNTKFGALVPCRTCGSPPCGNPQVDIAFTDHFVAASTLNEFGKVIQAIREVEPDPQLRLSSFLSYVTLHHPVVISATLPPELQAAVGDVLARVSLPAVEYKPGHRITHPLPKTYHVPLDNELVVRLLGARSESLAARTRVDVKLVDGTMRRSAVFSSAGTGSLTGIGEAPFSAEQVTAVRLAGSLFSFFRPGPWHDRRRGAAQSP